MPIVSAVRGLRARARASLALLTFGGLLGAVIFAGRCVPSSVAAQVSECSQPGACEDFQMCRRADECVGEAGDACVYDAQCDDLLVCISEGTSPKRCRPPSCANAVQDAGETRVDCGGSCRACVGCEQACDVGDPIDPPALATLSFTTGAYTRNSVGGYLPDLGVVEVADPNELRWASVSGGRMALFEGAGTNLLLNSGTLTGSGWSTMAPTSPISPTVAPDGMSSTKVIQYNNGADAFSLAQSVLVTPPTKLSFSLFARAQLAGANVPLLISEVDATGYDFAFGREVRSAASTFGRLDLSYNRHATPPMDGLFSWMRADRCERTTCSTAGCATPPDLMTVCQNLSKSITIEGNPTQAISLSSTLSGQPTVSISGPVYINERRLYPWDPAVPYTDQFVIAFVASIDALGSYFASSFFARDIIPPNNNGKRDRFMFGFNHQTYKISWITYEDYGGATTIRGHLQGPPIPVGEAFSAIVRSSASGTQLYINGVLAESTPVTPRPIQTWLQFGGAVQARASDMMFYERALSDTELGHLHAYIKDRYNIGPAHTPSAPAQTIASISHAGGLPDSGNRAKVPSDPYHLWGAQLEEQAFPTSYIPTTTTPVTRAADQLLYTAAQVPEWVRTGTFQLDTAPLYSSAEMKVNQAYRLFAFESGDGLSLVRDATGSYARLRSGGVDTSFPITWNRYQRLTFTIARATNQFTVEGALTGNGSSAGAGAFASSALRVGGAYAGGDEAFAAISELRQVVGVVASCPPDTTSGCGQCGNGVVDAGEQCDPAASPRCNAQCQIDELTPCDPSAPACAPGQVCPSTPNGPVFGAGYDKSFCIPSGPCLNTPTPACGTVDSACGICACTPSCGGKQCGDSPADGCGGVCSGFCDRGEPGCVSDTDCGPGFVCGQGNAWRFNPTAAPTSGGHACWPAGCEDIDPRRQSCGTTSSDCGRCDPTTIGRCYDGDRCNKGTGNCPPTEHENEIGICVPNDPNSDPDDVDTVAVGALPGEFGVTRSGASTYSVPIVVPPGRGGLAPEMSLVYNSTSGNGLLGLGWSLTGLSSIGVCSGTIAQDGSLNDREIRYCLDGQRIVPVAYLEDDNTTEWRTEFDSFVRIISPGNHYDFVPSGDHTPAWFTATTKAGRAMKYGTSAQSRMSGVRITSRTGAFTTVRQWALDEISDRSQNRVAIRYAKFQEAWGGQSVDVEILPTWVGYNLPHGTSLAAQNEIVLTYDGRDPESINCRFKIFDQPPPSPCGRTDRLHGFGFGAPIAQTRRLQSIAIHANGKKVRTYAITPQTSENGLTLTRSITECSHGPGGQVCRAPTEFEYEDIALTLGDPIQTPSQHAGTTIYDTTAHIALDGEANGYDDLAVAGRSTNYLFIAGSPEGFSPPTGGHSLGVVRGVPFAVDLEADGNTDIVVQTHLPGRPAGQIDIARWDRGSLTGSLLIPPANWPSGHPKRKNPNYIPFDPDGDGLPDLLYCPGDGGPWWVLQNNEGLFANPIEVTGSSGFCDESRVVSHADGRQVIVIGDKSRNAFKMVVAVNQAIGFSLVDIQDIDIRPSSHRLATTVDINGDSNQDLLFVENVSSGVYRWYLNTGAVYPNQARGGKWKSGGSGVNTHLAQYGAPVAVDFDLDGRGDLMLARQTFFQDPDLASTAVYLYRGADLTREPVRLKTFEDNNRSGTAISVLDANGDGRQDYVIGDKLFLGNAPAANLLKLVRIHAHANDIPDQIDVEYATGVAPDVYTQGVAGVDCARPGGTDRCLAQLPYPVVRSYARRSFLQGGVEPAETQSVFEEFAYTNAIADRNGRGLIGFSARTGASYGLGGVQAQYWGEYYELSRTPEGQDGPFLARDPTLATSADYNYYYYPYAGRPTRMARYTPLPASELAHGNPESSVTRVEIIDNTYETLSSDRDHRYVTLLDTQRTISEGPDGSEVPITDVKTVFDYDSYGNVTESATEWELSGFSRNVTYVYENNPDTHPQRIVDWQVDLMTHLIVEDKVAASGAGSSLFAHDMFFYKQNGLIEKIQHRMNDGRYKLVTEFQYDGWNNIDIVTQTPGTLYAAPPEGHPVRVYSITYDQFGVYPEEVQKPEGHVEGFDYSYANGRLKTYEDLNSFVTSMDYDGFGRIAKVEDTAANTTTFVAFASAALDNSPIVPVNAVALATTTVVANASNQALTSARWFDSSGRTVATAQQGFAAGNSVRTEYQYDEFGQLERSSRPHLAGDRSQGVEVTSYDSLGRPISVASADGELSELFYLSAGTVRSGPESTLFTNPDAKRAVIHRKPRSLAEGNPTLHLEHRVFDERGALISSGENYTTDTSFTYGAGGFVLSMTDAVGNRTENLPDIYNRVGSSTEPSTGSHEYRYDAWDQLTRHTHNTEVHAYRYDLLGRPTRLDNSDGPTTWTWDEREEGPNTVVRHFGALMEQFTSAGHFDTFDYEPSTGMLSTITRRVQTPSGPEQMAMGFEYDEFLRTELIHYPDSPDSEVGDFVVRNLYSSTGFLRRVENAYNSAEGFWSLEETYQGHMPQRVAFGDGTSTTYSREPLTGRLQSQVVRNTANQALLHEAFTYDANGNIKTLRRHHDPAESVETQTHFTYDGLDRLRSATAGVAPGAPVLEDLTYSDTGNILSKLGVGSYEYGLNGQGDSGPQTLPYFVRNTSGTEGDHTYVPDAFGRVHERSGPTVPGGTQTFGYTASGMLKQVTMPGVDHPIEFVDFDYGAGGDRVLRLDSYQNRDLYFGSLYERRDSPELTASVETLRVQVGGQTVAEVKREDGTRTGTIYLHRDHLGSPELMITTTPTGTTITRDHYDAFGARQATTPVTNVGFTGHRAEVDLGLTDMQARFYDARIGRFLSPDTIIPDALFSQAHNRFAYVYNNPLAFVDPTGHFGCLVDLASCNQTPDQTVVVTGSKFPGDPQPEGPVVDSVQATSVPAGFPKESTDTVNGDSDGKGRANPAPPGNASTTLSPRGGLGPYAHYPPDWRPAAFERSGHEFLQDPATFEEFERNNVRMWTEYGTQSALGLIPWSKFPVVGPVLDWIGGKIATAGRGLLARLIPSAARGAQGFAKFFEGGRTAKASELASDALKQGFRAEKSVSGPLKFVDEGGVVRLTIKQGSTRAPGSGFAHAEFRNAAGQRVDALGNAVTRTSPANHTPIEYDLWNWVQ